LKTTGAAAGALLTGKVLAQGKHYPNTPTKFILGGPAGGRRQVGRVGERHRSAIAGDFVVQNDREAGRNPARKMEEEK